MENFERLLRWVYDQPLFEKPALGQKPAFLSEEEGTVKLSTSSRFKRAVEALRNSREHAIPATTEYLGLLSEELEKLRITANTEPFDEAVVKSIDLFRPYRDETTELFLSLALYHDTFEMRNTLHGFFEQLIPYLNQPEHFSSYHPWDVDNFRFIIHELFLSAMASLVRFERFDSAAFLMSNDYFVPGRSEDGHNAMVSFEVFRKYMESLQHRNQRLKLGRLSLRADLLQQRCKGLGIEFRHLMQADFILFIRACLLRPDDPGHWWPETLLYARHHFGAFEVFARSRSARYFDRAKVLLGVESKDALGPLLQEFADKSRKIPTWDGYSFSPAHLLGFDEIATRP